MRRMKGGKENAKMKRITRRQRRKIEEQEEEGRTRSRR
jgi:hypothetical protein